MENLMNRSEQLASLRDLFFSELMALPEDSVAHPTSTDYLVEIGVEIVREFHFDTVTLDDLKHQAFMALGEYTDTLNNQWDGFDRDTYQDLEYQAQI